MRKIKPSCTGDYKSPWQTANFFEKGANSKDKLNLVAVAFRLFKLVNHVQGNNLQDTGLKSLEHELEHLDDWMVLEH